jgi:hypothetical protein
VIWGILGIAFGMLLVGMYLGRELECVEAQWLRDMARFALAYLVDGDVPNARYVLEQMIGEGE